tara:strand:- start:2179 stop:3033 length:855 start_codon:yes stop_codon:yes gene_type:complete
MIDKKKGDVKAFDLNWKKRKETLYTHWVKGEVQNQIQLAFRNHWLLFSEIISKTNSFNNGKRVLEIGCGRGSLSCYFSDAGYDCTLVDLSKKILSVAKKIFKKNKLKAKFKLGDANNLDFPDNSFDIIFSIGLLEHFENVKVTLAEQIRVLDKGGIWFGYIVPKYEDNVQKKYNWINKLLHSYHQTTNNTAKKDKIFRSDFSSKHYVKILKKLGLKKINASGVYPVPMISHSIDFPFSLMPKRGEKILVEHFNDILKKNKKKTGKNQWLCKEGYGNAFLVWGTK